MKSFAAADLAEAREALRWHFPSPAPQETLYSVFGRFHQLSGYRRSALTGHLLMGTGRASARRCVPFGLATLVELTAPLLDSVHTALAAHTVGALYLRFMSPEQRERAVQACAGVPTKRARFTFGWASSAFEQQHSLKACDHCMREDIKRHGFAYWHVQHQLPGVYWCIEHGCPLSIAAHLAPSLWALPQGVCLTPWSCEAAAERCAQALAQCVAGMCGMTDAHSGVLRACIATALEQAQVVRAARALNIAAVQRWLAARLQGLSRGCAPMVHEHCEQAANALTGRHGDHPLRWALLVTALSLEGASVDLFFEAANGPAQAQLAGFAQPAMYEAPQRAHAALGAGATWRYVAEAEGASRAVVERWRGDPAVRQAWQSARLEKVRAEYQAAVLAAIAVGAHSRAQLRLTCAAALQWLRRNDPLWLDRVIPATRGAQLPLWRDECN